MLRTFIPMLLLLLLLLWIVFELTGRITNYELANGEPMYTATKSRAINSKLTSACTYMHVYASTEHIDKTSNEHLHRGGDGDGGVVQRKQI